MFGFLKDKLKELVKKTKETLVGAPEPVKTRKQKKEKKVQVKEKPVKQQKKQKSKQEISQEREISEKVIKDIKQERQTEEIKTMPSTEEIVQEIKQVEKEMAQEVEEKAEEKAQEPAKKGFFARLKDRFSYKMSEGDFEGIFNSLEEILLENNTALEVIDEIQKKLKEQLVNKEIKKAEIEQKINEALRNAITQVLIEPFNFLDKVKSKKPFIILCVGINGSGKTTSIAKLSSYLQKNKLSCVLAAADTFRAASIEQIMKHGEKLGVKVIHHTYGSDPAAVAWDAIEYAKSHKIDVVLIDTAGRMHTKDNLIKEMEKICRVSKPDLKLFIGESITGNDATEQARTFNEAISIDGIILSKSDVDEKGGAALSVSFVTGKPILFLGTGQEYKDLKPFNKEEFVKQLGL